MNDVIDIAIEGGINYWADFKLQGDRLRVRPSEPAFDAGDPLNAWQWIDQAALAEAARKIVAREVECNDTIRGWLISEDIDACVADVLVQVAAFGEIVFG